MLVMGVGAQGCLSGVQAEFSEVERDSSGCVTAINSLTRNSAQQTLTMMRELAQLRRDASYTFVDVHSASLHIVDHAHAFGMCISLHNFNLSQLRRKPRTIFRF
jgi:hypothetical protein